MAGGCVCGVRTRRFLGKKEGDIDSYHSTNQSINTQINQQDVKFSLEGNGVAIITLERCVILLGFSACAHSIAGLSQFKKK